MRIAVKQDGEDVLSPLLCPSVSGVQEADMCVIFRAPAKHLRLNGLSLFAMVFALLFCGELGGII